MTLVQKSKDGQNKSAIKMDVSGVDKGLNPDELIGSFRAESDCCRRK